MIISEYDMMVNRRRSQLLCIASVLLALCLSVVTLPQALRWWRPDWLLLVMLYWTLVDEPRIGVTGAWLLGLVMDLLLGTLLGMHALMYVVIIFSAQRMKKSIARLPTWQLMGVVFMYVFVSMLMQWFIFYCIGLPVSSLNYWCPLIASVVFWPWIKKLLDNMRRATW